MATTPLEDARDLLTVWLGLIAIGTILALLCGAEVHWTYDGQRHTFTLVGQLGEEAKGAR